MRLTTDEWLLWHPLAEWDWLYQGYPELNLPRCTSKHHQYSCISSAKFLKSCLLVLFPSLNLLSPPFPPYFWLAFSLSFHSSLWVSVLWQGVQSPGLSGRMVLDPSSASAAVSHVIHLSPARQYETVRVRLRSAYFRNQTTSYHLTEHRNDPLALTHMHTQN